MNATNWKNIWERKGSLATDDLKELDGFESVRTNPEVFAKEIAKALQIKKTDKVLEVGCGAGMIGQYLECDYTGIDYSRPLVTKHIAILKHPVLVAEANDIPFKDKYFDKAFSFSVFHYFPDKAYVHLAIKELNRVCKGNIFIGDLPIKSHSKDHLLFKKDEFEGVLSKGFYNKDRFNILMTAQPVIKRNILLTPGPATTTDSVKQAQLVPDICPREKDFTDVMRKIGDDLVKIVGGDNRYASILFSGSGTCVMDACINSVVPPNKKIAVINNGAYGERMVKIANAYHIPCVEIACKWTQRPDPRRVQNILKKNRDVACVAMVHHETTSGILNPIEEIGAVAKDKNCSFIVDAISSFAGVPIDIKKSKIDYLFSASNKCIQGMAGIAFVICKTSELLKIKNFPPRSFYLNLFQQYDYFRKTGQMRFTPPVQVSYALRQAISEYSTEGAQGRRRRYVQNWRLLREGLMKIGFKLLLDEKSESRLLITVKEPLDPNYDFHEMHDLLYKRGFTIYPGKINEEKTFRIANIGAIGAADINHFLTALREIVMCMDIKLKYKGTTYEQV